MAIALQPQQLSSSMVTPGANRGRAGQRQHLEWGGRNLRAGQHRWGDFFLSILSGSGSVWGFSPTLSVSLNHPCEALVTFEWSNHEPVHHGLLRHGATWTRDTPSWLQTSLLLSSQAKPPLQRALHLQGPESIPDLPPIYQSTPCIFCKFTKDSSSPTADLRRHLTGLLHDIPH